MQAKKGNTVKVHYKGSLTDGTVFDSSEGKDPLFFVVGKGQVIPGFENGVEGMTVGEQKILNIPCQEAYGEIVKEAVFDIPTGSRLVLLHPESGEPMPVTIVSAENGTLTLDGNHPLAGKDLTFDITLEEVGEEEECCNDSEHKGCSCKH